MTQAIPGPQGCVLLLTAHSCQTGMLRHKIIGRLSKTKLEYSGQHRRFRQIAEVIIHKRADISIFIGAVTQTLACYVAFKMTANKVNRFCVGLFSGLND